MITPMLCSLAAALSAGCVSSGPNARQGPVGGTVADATAGGITSSNRGSGDAATGAAIGPAAGILTGAVAGNQVDRDRRTTDFVPSDRGHRVTQPPPIPASTPRHLTPIRPAREAVWIEGNWAYTGDPRAPYEWRVGHWEIPPAGARSWVPSGWQRTGNSYVYVRGRWR